MLADSLGFAPETTYGTYVAPSKFPQGMLKADPKYNPTRVQGKGLAGGRLLDLDDQYVEVGKDASGSVELEVHSKSFGLILQHLMGGSAVPVQQAATTAYLQTHVLGSTLGKSLTVQAGISQAGGLVRPYTFLGAKIKSAEFSCGVDDLLTCKVEVNARDLTEAQTLAAPSYLTGVRPFSFIDMGFKLGTFGAEAAVQGVTKMVVKIERPLYDGRYANNAGLKSEPIVNDVLSVSGTIDADFLDKTVFVDRFIANTGTSLVWEFVGPIIASTFAQTFRIRLPRVRFAGDTPTIDGADVTKVSIPFEAKFDGTNYPSIEYMSTDVAV